MRCNRLHNWPEHTIPLSFTICLSQTTKRDFFQWCFKTLISNFFSAKDLEFVKFGEKVEATVYMVQLSFLVVSPIDIKKGNNNHLHSLRTKSIKYHSFIISFIVYTTHPVLCSLTNLFFWNHSLHCHLSYCLSYFLFCLVSLRYCYS